MKERPVVILHWFAQNNKFKKNAGKTLEMMWATVILFYILFLFLDSFWFFFFFLSVLFCFVLGLLLPTGVILLSFTILLAVAQYSMQTWRPVMQNLNLFEICHTVCYSMSPVRYFICISVTVCFSLSNKLDKRKIHLAVRGLLVPPACPSGLLHFQMSEMHRKNNFGFRW